MLRRKKKSSKPPREARAAHGAHAIHETPAPRTRRRARPDAMVPAELRLGAVTVPETQEASPAPFVKPPVRRARAPRPLGGPAPQIAEGSRPAPRPSPRAEKGSGAILVTGFEPFGGEGMNPSWEICTRLPKAILGRRIETCLIPCEFRRAIEVAAEAIERVKPEMVVNLGQAGGRSQMGVERVGINVDDARAADNAGNRPIDEVIAENGPPAYFATLPVKAMVAAMRAVGVPAELSNTAGTYVCNHLMYGVLHFLAASGNAARAGFIHVPYAEEQVLDKPGTPSMAVATMARAIEAALAAALEHATDIKVSEGVEA